MNILVTGGAGFIGSQVAAAYLKAGHTVAVVDDLSTGDRKNIPAGAVFYELNITNSKELRFIVQEFQPEIINHHAAQVSVPASVLHPVNDAERNILGTVNLLSAALATHSVRRFIYATSGGSMYGDPEKLPCDESTPAKPVSPYALSKYTAEQFVWLLSKEASFTATVLRYSNVYGPGQVSHGEAGICAIFIENMLKGKPVRIYGDGKHIRDYVCVEDVVRANVAAIEKGAGEALNIGTGSGTTNKEVFDTVREALGSTQEVIMEPGRKADVRAIILDVSKAEKVLGWKAQLSFKEGIKKTVDWAKTQGW